MKIMFLSLILLLINTPIFGQNSDSIYTLSQRLFYRNGQLHGQQLYYDGNGQLVKTKVYKNGKLE